MTLFHAVVSLLCVSGEKDPLKHANCLIKYTTMESAEIKIGLQFKLTQTGRIYQVVKVTDVSVFFKDVTRDTIWRNSKNTFLAKFSNGFEKI